MPTARTIARGLWIIWAIVVWNVVFDHIIVVAGREYLSAAIVAPYGGPHPLMDDWMRPAVARGLWLATASAIAIVLVGFVAIHRATATRPSSAAEEPMDAGVQPQRVP
jgi:hypothetical protein